MILPYNDSDLQTVLQRILDDPAVAPIIAQLYPDSEALRTQLKSLHTINELQQYIMLPQVARVIDTTMEGFTSRVSSLLDPKQHYLFVSNHRDIILDAMLLDYVLFQDGHDTPYVIFGANLLEVPLMADLGRLNKLVSIERGGTPRDFYRQLDDTSRYIRQTITVQHQSVWIAQRNGRTKDGLDRTDPAIIKMLAMSASAPSGTSQQDSSLQSPTLTEALTSLHIVPVAISYEWEPCDLLKVREICAEQPYVKAPGDDTNSVITGLTQAKGHVHMTIDDPLTADEIADCHDDPHLIAALLDRRIHAAYHLHPTNLHPELLVDRLAQLSTEQERQALIKLYLNPATH